eukprot:CAMPEP_0194036802 /NCGR_PEP_ID=MMETSP0009_2-20130614/9170_1 /TAXON_ID=210454 /ORGANISM="Grammatophora oceanica, Strain CCMP 410" /LENGTH=150 /DNA_ID=CAMNT_0038678715 /DNA_START=182 /DNA_END=634 /DNA_ORIENTATION=-
MTGTGVGCIVGVADEGDDVIFDGLEDGTLDRLMLGLEELILGIIEGNSSMLLMLASLGDGLLVPLSSVVVSLLVVGCDVVEGDVVEDDVKVGADVGVVVGFGSDAGAVGDGVARGSESTGRIGGRSGSISTNGSEQLISKSRMYDFKVPL